MNKQNHEEVKKHDLADWSAVHFFLARIAQYNTVNLS